MVVQFPGKNVGLALLLGISLGVGSTLGIQYWQALQRAQESAMANIANRSVGPFSIAGDPVLGNPKAPLTLVEFSDFECPYCRAFHETTFPQLKRDYIDTGLVRFVHKDLPLPFHPQARIAAESARCSLNQTEYWQVYRALFRQQDCLSCKGAASIARTASQNPHHFEQCLRSQASKAAVERNLTDAMAIGIRATPTLVIGISQGQRHSGQTIEGVPPWPALHAQLQRELKGRSKTSTDR